MTSVVASGFRSRRLGETGEAPWQTAGWRGSTRGEAGCAGKRWNDSLMEERSVEGYIYICIFFFLLKTMQIYYLHSFGGQSPKWLSVGKTQGMGRALLPSRSPRGKSISSPFPVSGSLVYGPFLHPQGQWCWSESLPYGHLSGSVFRVPLQPLTPPQLFSFLGFVLA